MNNSRFNADVNKVLNQACAFSTIANLCETEGAIFKCSPTSRFAAGAANSAFACELFLKALLLYSGKTLDDIKKIGHDLLKLFRGLEEVNSELASSIETEVMSVVIPVGEGKAFSTILEESSGAFEFWRYIHEKQIGKTSPQFIKVLRHTLEKVCREKLAYCAENGCMQEEGTVQKVLCKQDEAIGGD